MSFATGHMVQNASDSFGVENTYFSNSGMIDYTSSNYAIDAQLPVSTNKEITWKLQGQDNINITATLSDAKKPASASKKSFDVDQMASEMAMKMVQGEKKVKGQKADTFQPITTANTVYSSVSKDTMKDQCIHHLQSKIDKLKQQLKTAAAPAKGSPKNLERVNAGLKQQLKTAAAPAKGSPKNLEHVDAGLKQHKTVIEGLNKSVKTQDKTLKQHQAQLKELSAGLKNQKMHVEQMGEALLNHKSRIESLHTTVTPLKLSSDATPPKSVKSKKKAPAKNLDVSQHPVAAQPAPLPQNMPAKLSKADLMQLLKS